MKTILIISTFLFFCTESFSQNVGRRSSDDGSDSSAKKKSKILKNPNMANGVVLPNATDNNTTPATTDYNNNSNTNTMQLPAANLDELNQRIAELRLEVRTLQNRLSFSGLNVIKYKAQPDDLEPTGNASVPYRPQVRINHPLCNNMPDAKLFVQSTRGLSVSTFFSNGYWYIRTPLFYSESIMQYGLADYTTIGGYIGTMLDKNVDFNTVVKNGGVLRANYFSPNYGEEFTILVLKDLPNYKAASYQK